MVTTIEDLKAVISERGPEYLLDMVSDALEDKGYKGLSSDIDALND